MVSQTKRRRRPAGGKLRKQFSLTAERKATREELRRKSGKSLSLAACEEAEVAQSESDRETLDNEPVIGRDLNSERANDASESELELDESQADGEDTGGMDESDEDAEEEIGEGSDDEEADADVGENEGEEDESENDTGAPRRLGGLRGRGRTKDEIGGNVRSGDNERETGDEKIDNELGEDGTDDDMESNDDVDCSRGIEPDAKRGQNDDEGNAAGAAGAASSDKSSETKTKGSLEAKLDKSMAKKPSCKRGIIYISRLPPGMEVTAVRTYLSRVAPIGRIWLRRESQEKLEDRRILTNARRGQEFRDGWVEFLRRRDAEKAVEILNGRAMRGAKRRGRWAEDLWCLRYLKGVRWEDLREGGRERILKVREEVAAARRERGFVEERVGLAKKIGEEKVVRRFRQKRVVEEGDWEVDVDEQRAMEVAKRMEEGKDGGALDEELMGMLFKKRRMK